MSSATMPPRMRPLSSRKTAIISVLDVGTTKIVCLIARLQPIEPSEMLRGRTHRCRILGIGHQRSRGIKSGTVVDMEAAEGAIRLAVDAAERMAGVQVQSVIVNNTGGRIGSHFFDAKIAVGGHAVSDSEVHRVLEACHASVPPGRTALHSLPTGFSLGSADTIRDPRGLIGEELGAAMHVVSTESTAARNLMLAIERCHLSIDAVVATPYASGLSALVDDEAELGTAIIDIGGGTTSAGIFSGGNLTHVDAFAVGGRHVTMDLARGLNIPLADAERLKTLHGSCLGSASDDRETIAVTQVGDDGDHATHLPKSQLTRIIKPRVEEILELVRDRLKAAGLPAHSGRRIVLTGGACQLAGLPEAAKRIISGQVRVGRPLGIQGLPESAKGPAFAAAIGLLVYPQVSGIEHFRPVGSKTCEPTNDNYISRVGRWLKDSF
jgi:cell division protein FtsA